MENVILKYVELINDCPANPQRTDCIKCDMDCQKIAIAAERHLFRILKEPCTEHEINEPFDDGIHWLQETDRVDIAHYKHRKDCPECLAEIEKEIER